MKMTYILKEMLRNLSEINKKLDTQLDNIV